MKFQADGEATQFTGQVNKPNRHAQAHTPMWLEISMSRQRHLAGRHPQLPLGEEGIDLLSLAGRKPHHFRTVSAPLIRFSVVQFFGRGVGGGAVNLLKDRFQFGQTLTAGFPFVGQPTDHGVVEDLRSQSCAPARGDPRTSAGSLDLS